MMKPHTESSFLNHFDWKENLWFRNTSQLFHYEFQSERCRAGLLSKCRQKRPNPTVRCDI